MANGSYPASPLPLRCLNAASTVIACDGAAASLHQNGIIPDEIVGDMDSLSHEIRQLYADRVHRIAEQESNDLTKAVRYAAAKGHREALILGATGLREDHTLGNISLLLDYAAEMDRIEMLTDFGLFTPVLNTPEFSGLPGRQISIFAPRPGVHVTTVGLRWPINNRILQSWWQGTLNEVVGSRFEISVTGKTGVIVYRPNEP